ncbi:VOC family protein [Pseudarthrobacter sp. R1]|uniref:VOC family protein n=1 Tax=Pseudarthrobacter sp. R1 TaxID=2944934 RepID=UPI0027E29CF8|nr:VOC family protein [Pseudarthrobacter sp. R1]
MTLRIQSLCIDSTDPKVPADFWEKALGWRRTYEADDEIVLEPPAGSPEDGVSPDLLFLKVPERKEVKNRLHLDLRTATQRWQGSKALVPTRFRRPGPGGHLGGNG